MGSPSFEQEPAVSGGAPPRLRLLQERERRQGLPAPCHGSLRLALDVLEREKPEAQVRVTMLPSRQVNLKPPELSKALRLLRQKLPDPGLGWVQELAVR